MQETVSREKLPAIPLKRYFTIGEVSELCAVKPHVLRYWEQEFPQLKPSKRQGNRRYYQKRDVLMVRQIRSLLYEDGFTIVGARQKLVEPPAPEISAPTQVETSADLSADRIKEMRRELEQVLSILEAN